MANDNECITYELEDCAISAIDIECIVKNAMCSAAVAENLHKISKHTYIFISHDAIHVRGTIHVFSSKRDRPELTKYYPNIQPNFNIN